MRRAFYFCFSSKIREKISYISRLKETQNQAQVEQRIGIVKINMCNLTDPFNAIKAGGAGNIQLPAGIGEIQVILEITAESFDQIGSAFFVMGIQLLQMPVKIDLGRIFCPHLVQQHIFDVHIVLIEFALAVRKGIGRHDVRLTDIQGYFREIRKQGTGADYHGIIFLKYFKTA